MKKVYVVHPLRKGTQNIGEISRNINRITHICTSISKNHPDVLILSPIPAFSFISSLGPQDWVLSQCRALLELANELWVYGDWQQSEGCRMEVEHARKLGITVVFEDGRVEGGTSTCPSFDA